MHRRPRSSPHARCPTVEPTHPGPHSRHASSSLGASPRRSCSSVGGRGPLLHPVIWFAVRVPVTVRRPAQLVLGCIVLGLGIALLLQARLARTATRCSSVASSRPAGSPSGSSTRPAASSWSSRDAAPPPARPRHPRPAGGRGRHRVGDHRPPPRAGLDRLAQRSSSSASSCSVWAWRRISRSTSAPVPRRVQPWPSIRRCPSSGGVTRSSNS